VAQPRRVPSPYHPLHGFRLKYNRANAYAKALESEIDNWFKRQPYETFGDFQPGPPEEYFFRIRFFELPPSEWGLILGDFAHNARSALDQLAYQVVLLGNGGVHQEQTQFPIVLAPWNWPKEAKKRLRGASSRHVDIIESFQPYHRRDLYGWNSVRGAIEDPLAILNRLSNVDKHIVLNATAASVQTIGWDVESVRDVASIGTQQASMGFLEDDGVLVRIGIIPNGPNPELRLTRSETVEIRVQHRVDLGPDSYTLLDVPLDESLDAILVRLRQLFNVFVNEFR
jgi:hypothetical protein